MIQPRFGEPGQVVKIPASTLAAYLNGDLDGETFSEELLMAVKSQDIIPLSGDVEKVRINESPFDHRAYLQYPDQTTWWYPIEATDD